MPQVATDVNQEAFLAAQAQEMIQAANKATLAEQLSLMQQHIDQQRQTQMFPDSTGGL